MTEITNVEPNECCICFETIGKSNNCVTKCGHAFCFECITKSLTNNNTCPCCRAVIMDVPEENDDDESEYEFDSQDGSDDEEEDDGEDDEEPENLQELIAERFTKKGYTLIDAMYLLTGFLEKNGSKHEKEHIEKIEKMRDCYDEIYDDILNEHKEQKMFENEDVNCLKTKNNIIMWNEMKTNIDDIDELCKKFNG
jgi:hypothetical protein